ncbi:MAG TPA: hypothetical protein VMF30_15535 [Pirellulales bacterium]|nr:hypothetical protein [Pirellulales bacterium]
MQGISTQDVEQPDRAMVVADIYSTTPNDKYLNDLLSRIGIEPSVSNVSWERVQ